MSALSELKHIYEKYEQTLNGVCKTSSPIAKFLGLGVTPRNHPCNMDFYNSVGDWVSVFSAATPSEEVIYEAVMLILSAACDQQNEDAYWYMYTAQGYCKPLIPQLSTQHRIEIRSWYDQHYPKRKRLPIQHELYRLLCE